VKELHILPCADTLLYLPVYLALDALRENPRYAFVKRDETADGCIWEYRDLRILLHAASGGDDLAVKSLIKCQSENPESSCVAIADPLIALHAHAGEGLRVVATFINRIALSSVFKEPHKGKKAYWGHLSRLRDAIHEKGRLLGPEFKEFDPYLKVAFCEQGETNKSLLRHFLGVSKSAAKVEGFGQAEFEVVVNGHSDVSFTAAPWLKEGGVDLFNLGKDKLHTESWLPSIPYPFSSIITTKESWDTERECQWRGPIGTLVRHMLIAAALLARYRDKIGFALYRQAGEFRNFGLPAKSEAKSHHIILAAVRHLVERDYLAEDLSNAWVAWDFAAEASCGDPKRLSWQSVYPTYLKAVEREKNDGFWRNVADDLDFWKNDFRSCMNSYLRSDRLSGPEKWPVPMYKD
jgi:hypothetical protein